MDNGQESQSSRSPKVRQRSERQSEARHRVGIAFCGLLSIVLLAQVASAQQPRIEAELDRQQVFEGEPVRYRVVVRNVDEAEEPQLAVSDEFTVQSVGSQASRQLVIINGRRTERISRLFEFIVTPKQTGMVTIPAPTVNIAGRTYTGNELRLKVVPATEQDLARVRIELDSTHVYPLQRFTVTVRVAIKQIDSLDEDPIYVLNRPPTLSIPWRDASQIEGLEPTEPWQRWLGKWQRQDSGFQIEGVRVRGNVFAMLDGRGSGGGFHPQPMKVRYPDKDGRPTPYWEYTFPRSFTAQRSGTVTLGPVSLRGRLGTRLVAQRRLEVEPVYALARAVSIDVREPPVAGRPASYHGAIGQFNWTAALSAPSAKVGDPLTLTLTARGTGTLDAIQPPQLAEWEPVSRRFRVYDARTDTDAKGGTRTFTYNVRPLAAGTTDFPGIPFTYFDVDKERYITIESPPVPLTVVAVDRLQDNEITLAQPGAGDVAGGVQTRQEGIFANVADPRLIRDETVRPIRSVVSWLALGGVFLVVAVIVRQVRRRVGDESRQRRQDVIQQVRQLEESSGGGSAEADRVGGTIRAIVGEAQGLDAAALTTPEIRRVLEDKPINSELIEQAVSMLEACDQARYAGGDLPAEQTRSAAAVCRQLVDALGL